MGSYINRKLLYPLVALLLIVSIGWIISPAFVSSVPPESATTIQDAARTMSMPGGSGAPQFAPGTLPAGNFAPGSGQVIVSQDVKHDVSPPLSSMIPLSPMKSRERERENEYAPMRPPSAKVKDPVLQNWFSPLVMPSPILNFDGMNHTNSGFFIPPDTNGDVGPNHYVQWVNAAFQIFNKAGGSVFGPAAGNTIWSGFGGVCQSTNDGDPIVLYDPIADRWLFSQLSFTGPPFHQCIAVSTTSNPAGPYFRYDFVVSSSFFGDYPKFGVWPDAYYMTSNQFQLPSTYVGPAAIAFDRNRMLSGLSASMVKFDQSNSVLTNSYFGLLPSDQDGPTPPPGGSPNYIVTWDGPFLNRLYFFKFHVDFITPGNSTMTGPTQLVTAAFNQLCAPAGACITQPGTGQLLDSLEFDQMHRFAYRNFGTHESLVTNHSVDATGGNLAAVRWYELRAPNAGTFIHQQGTFSPDSIHRWMGSIAMDHSGNIAIGYSASSTGVFPSIRYAGRLVTDPLNQLSQGEATLIGGGGSQTGAWCSPNCNRWGDYSNMSVDPADDCTFWYTTEYIQTTGSGWRTRIGSFKFPSCTNATATPTATPTNTPTRTRTPTPTVSPTSTPNTNTAFAYFLPAGPITITTGTKLELELWVNTGGNTSNVAQHYLTFTHNVVQMVNFTQPGCVLTSTVTADVSTFDAVLQNETCNGPSGCVFRGSPIGPGSFAFASGALGNPPANGDFRVAQTAWCGSVPGDAVLHWQFSPPDPLERDTEIVDEFGNLVHNPGLYTDYVIHVVTASTPTPTSTPVTAVLVGHVTWQGPPAQPNVRQQLPITLTLKSGTTEVNYPSQNTDSSGFFTVSVSSLPAGTYNWRVKGPKFLANGGSVGLTGVPQTNSEMGLMRAGDCDNNNLVNVSDFTILKNSFGKSIGQPGYDARADFNGDDAVSVVDFNLQKGNFGQSGAPPILPLQR